ncbi:MAG: NAD(P)/FAD-dependent oxidoreductase [Verrucomicrobia bacterium]|nr:NAD(P)/FAD-dependent oxidoreductase [Verrucomicrobiota bacterium]MDA1067843.1 NAD(P)/FAD-dependent oxidoreductase [Verrucomicrobiota bacterium]
MTYPKDYDAIVIGGGPAGSTAGALLAEKGWKVLIIEKEKFPRYHVGESLMPYCYFTFERLGVIDKIKEMAWTEKHSVQFVGRNGKVSTPFYFFQHYEHPSSTTWQVKRADFDLMLLDNAREKGATALEETTVTEFIKDDKGAVVGVKAQSVDGQVLEFNSRIVLDGSGRDALFLRKTGSRKRDPELNKIAIWTLFKGAMRDPGLDEGSTTVAYLDGKGWFWNIPMADDIVSSGIVADRDYLYRDSRDPKEIYEREIKNNPWIEEHLSQGKQFGEYWVTGEYSYRGEHCATDGLVLIGDAFAFLDPVFSSGVFLAVKSAEMAADAADEALKQDKPIKAADFEEYGERLCSSIETMRQVVYAFYDERFSFADLIKANMHLRGTLTDCLIGDLIDRDYAELLDAMKDFASLPEPLSHGRANMNPVAQ